MKNLCDIPENDSQAEEINITPLVDVIFILLIFFIVTMSFSNRNSLEIDTPSAENNKTLPQKFTSIEISQNGAIRVNELDCTLSALPAKINTLNSNEVAIFADKNVPAQKLVEVIDAVKSVKNASIYLATKEK